MIDASGELVMASTQAATLIARDRDEPTVQTGEPRSLELDGRAWDNCLQELGGQLHQSWSWGELQSRHGRQVERFSIVGDAGTAMAQVLFKPYGPVSTASVPRGPVVSGDADSVLPALWARIEAACRRHRAIALNVEPDRTIPFRTIDGRPPSFDGTRYSPKRTVIVPLSDDESLVKQMHASKRREVRRAERHGIGIEFGAPSGKHMDAFYELLIDTSTRNRIRISSYDYYADFLRVFGDDAALILAVAEGKVAAGLIAGRFGDTGTYVFGGSSTSHRVSGATAYLQYSAMRWARERGCTKYDLAGIPDKDPPSYVDADGKPIRSVGDSYAGLYRFKVELGGQIVSYPPSFEIRYRPGLSWAMRRMKDLGHVLRG